MKEADLFSGKFLYSNSFLVFSNAVIVLGVLFFQWDIFHIMFLFWFESVTIGIFQIAKLWVNPTSGLPEKNKPNLPEKTLLLIARGFGSIFFFIHYNGFNAGHLVFLVVLPSLLMGNQPDIPLIIGSWLGVGFHEGTYDWFVKDYYKLITYFVIFFSYMGSFLSDTVLNKDRQSLSIVNFMKAPYRRIFTMHITIILGAVIYGFFFDFFRDSRLVSAVYVSVFVVLKTFFDLKNHKKMEEKSQFPITKF